MEQDFRTHRVSLVIFNEQDSFEVYMKKEVKYTTRRPRSLKVKRGCYLSSHVWSQRSNEASTRIWAFSCASFTPRLEKVGLILGISRLKHFCGVAGRGWNTTFNQLNIPWSKTKQETNRDICVNLKSFRNSLSKCSSQNISHFFPT